MGYEQIDNILNTWADKHGLSIYKNYKGEQVRSFEIGNLKGQSYQIWVDLPDINNQVNVHVWDYKKKRKDFVCLILELFETLENAYRTVEIWSSDKINLAER